MFLWTLLEMTMNEKHTNENRMNQGAGVIHKLVIFVS